MSEQKKGRTAAENVALATNAAGAVGGPAAIYMAYKGARNNEGGMPRAAVKAVTGGEGKAPNRFGRTKIGAAIRRGAENLDAGKTKGAKRAAVAAGVGSVALQGANWAGDTIAARSFAAKGKQDNTKPRPDAKRLGMNPAMKKHRPEQGISKAYDDGRRQRGQGSPMQTRGSVPQPRAEVAGRAYASRADRERDRLSAQRRNTAIGIGAGGVATGVGGATVADTIRRKASGQKADLLRSKTIKFTPKSEGFKAALKEQSAAEKTLKNAGEDTKAGAQKVLDDVKARIDAMTHDQRFGPARSKRVLRPTGRAALASGAVLGPAAIYGAARSHKSRTTSWN